MSEHLSKLSSSNSPAIEEYQHLKELEGLAIVLKKSKLILISNTLLPILCVSSRAR